MCVSTQVAASSLLSTQGAASSLLSTQVAASSLLSTQVVPSSLLSTQIAASSLFSAQVAASSLLIIHSISFRIEKSDNILNFLRHSGHSSPCYYGLCLLLLVSVFNTSRRRSIETVDYISVPPPSSPLSPGDTEGYRFQLVRLSSRRKLTYERIDLELLHGFEIY